SKVTPPMAYQAMEKLFSHKITTLVGKKVKIDFRHPYAYRFKLLYDAERLMMLSKEDQNKVQHIFQAFKSEYQQALLGLLVFGSTASGEKTEQSDIDVLIIVKEKKEIDYDRKGLLNLGKINLIEKSQSELEGDYLLAQDLVLNAFMRGIIIHDSGILRRFLSKPLPSPSEEVFSQKEEYLEKLKKRLLLLLKDNDALSLMVEFRAYLVEKFRLELLRQGVISSSKQDLLKRMSKSDRKLYLLYQKLTPKTVRKLFLKHVGAR
ncbi:nucleotidyltransferase domain-containing protein, partial [Candidatus Woesearchaeota archaeon]|nr:nucleotidyltransferase domain-containing protein [Candidatus Woesearchaeota archaeon]